MSECGRVIPKPGRGMYVICRRPSVDGGPCAYHRGVDRRADERVKARAAARRNRQPRTLGPDDPEPAVGSVVLDADGDAAQRIGDAWWYASDDYPFAWGQLANHSGPLYLIHDGGQ